MVTCTKAHLQQVNLKLEPNQTKTMCEKCSRAVAIADCGLYTQLHWVHMCQNSQISWNPPALERQLHVNSNSPLFLSFLLIHGDSLF